LRKRKEKRGEERRETLHQKGVPFEDTWSRGKLCNSCLILFENNSSKAFLLNENDKDSENTGKE
jgi:hypothetical protein